MHRIVSLLVCGLAVVGLMVGVPGCGPAQFDVTGEVKYNGMPLDKPGGQVVFLGPNGTQVPASIGPNGAYRASKVTAGLNRVAVYYSNPAVQGKRSRKGQPLPDPSQMPSPFLTPAKYASTDTSGLSVEVANGTVFNINLTGPPIP